MNRIVLFFVVILIPFFMYAQKSQPQIPAFPGAEGGGMYVTGGRGGKVFYVTSLADDGSVGTLRWAINQQGPRNILFKVSGIIDLKSQLAIRKGDVTIAGQTAPGNGICLRNYDLFVGADNVIIRFMRFRLGDLVPDREADSFGGKNHKNIIIDHCSASWSVDECASFYSNENFTLQWSIISESLNKSEHAKGIHGYGGIWGGKNASFHHNLIAHHNGRNPRLNGLRRAGLNYFNTLDEERVDFRNNVVYNWGKHSSYGGESGRFNMVANYFKYGPATESKMRNRITDIDIDEDTTKCPPGYGKYFIQDNYVFGFPDVTLDNWKGVQIDGGRTKSSCNAGVPFKCTPITKETAEVAYHKVLAYSGASLFRDTVDARIVREVKEGICTYTGSLTKTPGLIDSQTDVGGRPVYKSIPAPVDSNEDGIPDVWLEKKFPGKIATDKNKQGYTYLEVYLNEMVDHIVSNQMKVAGK